VIVSKNGSIYDYDSDTFLERQSCTPPSDPSSFTSWQECTASNMDPTKPSPPPAPAPAPPPLSAGGRSVIVSDNSTRPVAASTSRTTTVSKLGWSSSAGCYEYVQ
jgi:hypothetical protein